MKIERPKNTKKEGTIEFLVYKEGKTFVGVCLTFDIVEEGKNPEKLMEREKKICQMIYLIGMPRKSIGIYTTKL